MTAPKTTDERYREKLVPLPNGCIGWDSSVGSEGNARFIYLTRERRWRTIGAHRYAWERARGPVPEGRKMKNTCGLGSCQNLEHWTLQDSARGMTPRQRYEARFARLGPDECWPWQEKGRDKNGHALLSWRENGETVTVRVTRWAWDQLHPESLLQPHEAVRHTCGDNSCQNPGHWALSTTAEIRSRNVPKRSGPRVRAGRTVDQGYGETHYNTNLTWNDIREIRRRYAEGETTQRALAGEFGISRTAVGKIIQNERWVIDQSGNPVGRGKRPQ